MLRRVVLGFIGVCLLCGQAACGAAQPDLQSTEAVRQEQAQQTLDVKTTRQAQFTANAQATNRIEQTIQAQETQKVEKTESAVDTTATAEAEANNISNATATAGQIATATAVVIRQQTSTANAIVRSTAQAQPMLELVNHLVDEGYLTTNEGDFYPLVDFDESWAQLGWYWFFPTGYAPSDFVIRASAEWDSASQTPDPSGCGFVFREDGQPNHYVTFFGTDGNVYFSRYYKGVPDLIGKNYYGIVGVQEGAADIVLAVEGNWITYLVNGQMVLREYDEALSSGNLDYTLISGTNKDYGTHCRMTNIGLWVIK
jgi:hypothetical protein